MPIIKALDVSSFSGLISDTQWRDCYDDGWGMAIVQAWGALPGGGSGPNPHCEVQLSKARAAGLLTAIYIVIPPDTDPYTHELIRVAKEAAGDEYRHVQAVALDIEDEERRRLHPTDPAARLLDAISNVGHKPVWIYTSPSMWLPMMLESLQFRRIPLWDARWSVMHGLDDGWVPYGGWTQRAMRQYQGTTDIHGITADLNIGDLDRLGITSTPPPDFEAELNSLRTKLDDIQTLATHTATLAQSVADALRNIAER